jgi:ankyrin repeat protein
MLGIQPNLDPDTKDFNQELINGNFTPFLALLYNEFEFVTKQHIVDVSLMRQAVHLVSHFGDIQTMRALVEHFMVELFEIDNNGYHSIHYACSSGEIAMLSYISAYASPEDLEL